MGTIIMRYILGLRGIMKKKTETVIIGYSIYWGYIYIYIYVALLELDAPAPPTLTPRPQWVVDNLLYRNCHD